MLRALLHGSTPVLSGLDHGLAVVSPILCATVSFSPCKDQQAMMAHTSAAATPPAPSRPRLSAPSVPAAQSTSGSTREAVRDAVLAHLLQALQNTPQEDQPFSHFYVKGMFPKDIYGQMVAMLPEPNCFRPLSLEKYARSDGTSTRDVLELNETMLAPLPPASRALWLGIADALMSAALKHAVFDKLSVDLSQRFRVPRTRLCEVVAYPKPALIRDVGGYEIAPHPDVRKKIVTMQFYLPSDGSQVDLGTALYVRHGMVSTLLSKKRRFEKVKQFAFLPNSGYGFAVSGHSWHGRDLVPMASGVRNSLLLIYYNQPNKGY
jgi:hypothetical protein